MDEPRDRARQLRRKGLYQGPHAREATAGQRGRRLVGVAHQIEVLDDLRRDLVGQRVLDSRIMDQRLDVRHVTIGVGHLVSRPDGQHRHRGQQAAHHDQHRGHRHPPAACPPAPVARPPTTRPPNLRTEALKLRSIASGQSSPGARKRGPTIASGRYSPIAAQRDILAGRRDAFATRQNAAALRRGWRTRHRIPFRLNRYRPATSGSLFCPYTACSHRSRQRFTPFGLDPLRA